MSNNKSNKVKNHIQRLWDYGYFFCPSVSEEFSPENTGLGMEKVSRSKTLCNLAIKQFQTNFKSQLQNMVFETKGRDLRIDGVAGSQTKKLLKMDRCGCLDYNHPAMIGTGVQVARPGHCRKGITLYTSLNFSHITASEQEIYIQEAFKNWSRELDVTFRISKLFFDSRIGLSFQHDLHKYTMATMTRGDGSCDQKLTGRFNPNFNWDHKKFVAALTHELGHALGLGHIYNDPDAVMQPVIHKASKERYGKLNRSDVNAMLDIGYNSVRDVEPAPAPSPTPEPIKPKPKQEKINAFKIKGKWYEIWKNPEHKENVVKWFKDNGTQYVITTTNYQREKKTPRSK